MQAIILVGGLGKRLSSVVSDRPKPMALIADRPFLEYQFLRLRAAGITDIIISAGYKGSYIQDYFDSGEPWGIQLQYAHEPEPLGTGGAIKFCEPYITSDTMLVMNGDVFFDIDITVFLAKHKQQNAFVTLALAQVENAERFGFVEVNKKNEITSFAEKVKNGPGTINGGMYAMHREILSFIPAGRAVSVEREIFPQLIGKGFYGQVMSDYMIDIGTPESYAHLCKEPELLFRAARIIKHNN